MSYGDPNNPYGSPQGQPQQPPQQQGYGYPQQQPQAPGYGYPQAPPVQQSYGGGAPMTQMPGTVNTARILLWVIVGLQVIGALVFAFSAVAIDQAKDDAQFEAFADYPTGVLWGFAVFALAWLVWAAILATKFNSGTNGTRVTILVFGIITAVLGIYPFTLVGIVHLVLGILIAVFAGNANGKAWFNRARY
ncbi:hypothetical protein K4B79_37645 [Streptomyces lincolnensis]|uniref:hypothetical protein n=1 Tax=Streptomyces lincolnensis TaxID=1915 RepID=UPI001E47D086|nr:hypothetical protein [Streptomyces lincolnensis]MCD7443920.1 hypothetical protein [Streptomyces lincolnensis]